VAISKAAHKDNENLKLTGSSSGKAVKIIDKKRAQAEAAEAAGDDSAA
jgi:hypothetical protein